MNWLKRNTRMWLGAVLSVGTVGAMAANEKAVFQAEATEKVVIRRDDKSGSLVTEQVKVAFHDLRQYNPDRRIIARETITAESSDNLEGERARAKVELYMGKPDGSIEAAPSSALDIPNVNEVKFRDDHWAATTFGCCDAEPYTRLYSYGGDKPFLRYNGGYTKVEVPNAKLTRYVGSVLRGQVPGDSAQEAIFGKNDKAVAAIAYAAPGKPLQKLLLQAKAGVLEDALPAHTISVSLSSKSEKDELSDYQAEPSDPKVMSMWSLDPAPDKKPEPTQVSGLIITASFEGNDGTTETVSIPVDNDRFGTATITGKTLEVVPEKQ